MKIRFGPAGHGGIKGTEEMFKHYHKNGLQACEVPFTYGVYVKREEDAHLIRDLSKKFDIELTVHAPYWVNLNAKEKEKVEASKQRILDSCKVGEWMNAKCVVFHPGYFMGGDREKAYQNIKKAVLEMQEVLKENKWKIELAPETMGKVNVFGSVEEISKLVKETGCGFCIDFAHILARDKAVDYKKIERLFPRREWHCHFSGIVYG
ncbi:MAG: TIM barrel protein, partial [Nanoarchaeota archaeon]